MKENSDYSNIINVILSISLLLSILIIFYQNVGLPLYQSNLVGKAVGFAIEDRVETVGVTTVYKKPGGSLIGTQPQGAKGTVVDGPSTANSIIWWKINFDSGKDGWVKETDIKKVGSTVALAIESCSPDKATALVNELVTWTANGVSGGSPPYSYSWSGTDGLSGTTNPVAKSYATTGTKTASVAVTDSLSKSANRPCSSGVNVLDTQLPTVWVTDSLTRVQPTDPPGSVTAASIKAARNEYEAFQVVVTAPTGVSLNNVNATVSDLVGPGTLPTSAIALYREHYVPVRVQLPATV